MNSISRQENIPVTYDVDVLVVGGGPAGVAAAIQAGRQGCSVLLVEQTNCLGGIATAGWHGHICMYNSQGPVIKDRIVGGLCYELAEILVAQGYGTYNDWALDFEVERLKFVLEELVRDAGNIQVLYYTQFCDVEVRNGWVEHAIIQNKSGRQAVKVKMVIDCTGDGDVAASAGAPFEKGRPGDGALQPMTLMFQMGGVDYPRLCHYREVDYPARYGRTDWGQDLLWQDLQDRGLMEPFQNHTCGLWWTATRPDQIGVNFTHIYGKDPTNTEDLTYATMEGRRQAYETVKVFRDHFPGFENSWMSHTAALIGTRESRRILGDYYLTADDLRRRCCFDDSIGYGSFFFDIHNCDNIGMDDEAEQVPIGFRYQIPYRVLVPQKLENVLVAGRCISCDHLALGSLRVMPQCFIGGDAAGIAASLAVKNSCTTRQVDVAKLQDLLREARAILTEEDIVNLP